MRKLALFLTTVVGLLAGCDQLQKTSVVLESQRLANCSFQGGVYRNNLGVIFTDISARCTSYKDDGKPHAKAYVDVQRQNSQGAWANVGVEKEYYKFAESTGTEVYTFDHVKASVPCSTSQQGGTFRGKIRMVPTTAAENEGTSTFYYTPSKSFSLANCV